MPCYKPLTAYHSPGGGITFDRTRSFGTECSLPCGQCIGCRLEKAREWALRCTHEASLYNGGLDNSFITLTYRDSSLPPNGNLKHLDFQKFIRTLRKTTGKKIRYYMCGEYGDKTNRPHYHAILFGHKFPDMKLVNIRRGNRVYTSQILESLWKKGDCEIGSVSFKSAGYVARYILKKQTKNSAPELLDRYVIIDTNTGEMTSRHMEYTRMSLKPGIGAKWYEQNKSDLFPHDYAILPDGRQTQVPAYYRRLLEKEDPKLSEILRENRLEKARINPDNSPERLAVREAVQKSKIKPLKRDYL